MLQADPAALADDDVIEDFDARIDVRTDSTLLITETIRVRFSGQWNGILRNIPYRYRPPGGRAFSTPIIVESVHDDDGRPLRRWLSRSWSWSAFASAGTWRPDRSSRPR